MKKIFPYFLIIISVFLLSLLWEYIRIPFNSSINIKGEDYLPNLHNPTNDSIRFILFISIPLLIFLFYQLNSEKIKFWNFLKINLLNNQPRKRFIENKSFENSDLTKLSLIFLIAIILQFLSLDMIKFISEIDMFHEGLWLSASSNAVYKNEFWLSSYIERGLFGNFYNYFLWKFFNINTIGISRYFPLIVTLLNKIILLFIAQSLIKKTFLKKEEKNFFLICFAYLIINLFDYDITAGSYFRLFGLLLLSLFLLNYFDNFKQISFSIFAIGFLSSFSIFWFIDIGFFVNFVILLFICLLIFNRYYLDLSLLLISILTGWFIFYIFLGKNEFLQFIINTKNILLTIEYIQGLIYPTPFFSLHTRSTKALLVILITGILLINNLNYKKENISINLKLSLVFLYIISCVNFKIALSRSDTVHIKAGILLMFIPFYFLLLKQFLKNYKILEYLKKTKLSLKIFSYSLLTIFIISLFIKDENINVKNINKFFSSSKNLIIEEDFSFISKDYKELIVYYKQLIKNDECVLIFTNENALPFLLKKPTCSKYHIPYTSSPIHLQKNFIKEIDKKKPNFIIYDSEFDFYDKPSLTMGFSNKYILNNYQFYKKINKWLIYKIN